MYIKKKHEEKNEEERDKTGLSEPGDKKNFDV